MLPIFAENLKRLDLLKLPVTQGALNIRVSVHRNHSFEMFASVLSSFLNFAGLKADWAYSSYDDSLNFGDFQDADIHLIWIDLSRYKTADCSDFLQERAEALRKRTNAPILIAHIGSKHVLNLAGKVAGVHVWNVEEALAHLKEKTFDESKTEYSGTRLSGKASLYAARELGLKYIPALLQPSLKALVVDLDNTLYQGVLGEDGIDALVPNLPLQQRIKNLKSQGFFLALASKNEEEDARALFDKRKDFILKWADFDAVEINWNSKAENIAKLADKLNIGLDAMLFIDDNPAEMQNVDGLGLKTILASDPEETVRMLHYFPGLLRLSSSLEDSLRSKDLKANEERVKLAQSLSPKEYFQKLGIRLVYSVNDPAQVPRVTELLGKTNQFILNYARPKEAEVENAMRDAERCVVTVAMSDNLADSGIIAILLGGGAQELALDELVVSCRALGRNLEHVMLPKMFMVAAERLGKSGPMQIHYKTGERNGPGLNWLRNLTGQGLSDDEGTVLYELPGSIDLDGLEIEIR